MLSQPFIIMKRNANMNVLLKAKEDIESILKSDYKLKSGENRPIREVLKILDRKQNWELQVENI